jgi:tetratricopeptide (TPR) repeat protein
LKKLCIALCLTLSVLLSGCGLYFDEEHEKNALNGMLVEEKYAALDKAFEKAEKQYRNGKLPTRQWENRWLAIADINADGIEPRFDSWVAQTGSPYAYLARGLFTTNKAWEARGAKLASETTDAQFSELYRLSEKAEKDLLVAREKISKCSICIAGLLRANRAFDRPAADSVTLLNEALASDSKSRAAVFVYFTGLYPQWRGSFKIMQSFIDDMERQITDPAVIDELRSRYCWRQADFAVERGDHDLALQWYERGVTAHPYDMLMKHLAAAYMERKEVDKAVKILEENLKLNDAWDLYTIEALAQAYFESGQQDKGKEMMRKRDEAQHRYNFFL